MCQAMKFIYDKPKYSMNMDLNYGNDRKWKVFFLTVLKTCNRIMKKVLNLVINVCILDNCFCVEKRLWANGKRKYENWTLLMWKLLACVNQSYNR